MMLLNKQRCVFIVMFKKRLELLHILVSVCDINAVKAAAQFLFC